MAMSPEVVHLLIRTEEAIRMEVARMLQDGDRLLSANVDAGVSAMKFLQDIRHLWAGDYECPTCGAYHQYEGDDEDEDEVDAA
jgi:hypothetical protein